MHAKAHMMMYVNSNILILTFNAAFLMHSCMLNTINSLQVEFDPQGHPGAFDNHGTWWRIFPNDQHSLVVSPQFAEVYPTTQITIPLHVTGFLCNSA